MFGRVYPRECPRCGCLCEAPFMVFCLGCEEQIKKSFAQAENALRNFGFAAEDAARGFAQLAKSMEGIRCAGTDD